MRYENETDSFSSNKKRKDEGRKKFHEVWRHFSTKF